MTDSRIIDLTGQRFGRGVVLAFVGRRGSGKNKTRYWRLQCDCGKEYEANTGNLRVGHVRSCGCFRREAVIKNALNCAVLACTKPPGVAAFNQLLAVYKKGARENNRTWQLTDEEFRRLIYGDCHYCGQPPSRMHRSLLNGVGRRGTGILVNGVDRVDSTAGYTLDNCVSCCYQCNLAKRNMTPEDFVAWIERVHAHIQRRENGQ